MNIFRLDSCPNVSANWLCDKHIVSQLNESGQIISNVNGGPMRPFNPNHPASLWAGSSETNYKWLIKHAWRLGEIYTEMYKKVHANMDLFFAFEEPVRPYHGKFDKELVLTPGIEFTESVSATYVLYYRQKSLTIDMRYTKRDPPTWLY